ncbi:MAG: DUF4276 family protein [Magnetococcus sp. WYHC-3]
MVQCMEYWFLADVEKLKYYYGRGFDASPLPGTQPLETASKESVLKGLEKATKHTSKGSYSKGDHSFAILETLDVNKVCRASPWAARLIKVLKDAM